MPRPLLRVCPFRKTIADCQWHWAILTVDKAQCRWNMVWLAVCQCQVHFMSPNVLANPYIIHSLYIRRLVVTSPPTTGLLFLPTLLFLAGTELDYSNLLLKNIDSPEIKRLQIVLARRVTKNSKTPPHNRCFQITSLVTSPSVYPLWIYFIPCLGLWEYEAVSGALVTSILLIPLNKSSSCRALFHFHYVVHYINL